jgi:hypothetical protein
MVIRRYWLPMPVQLGKQAKLKKEIKAGRAIP